jgi:hypothetical protein
VKERKCKGERRSERDRILENERERGSEREKKRMPERDITVRDSKRSCRSRARSTN